MKKFFMIICYWVLILNYSIAQVPTFSIRYPFQLKNSIFKNSLEINNKYYTVGGLLDYTTFSKDGYIVCVDKNGTEIFSKQQKDVDSLDNPLILSNIVNIDNYLFASGIVGKLDSNVAFGYTYDPILIKYDTLGNVIWTRKDYRTSNRLFNYSYDLKFLNQNLYHIGNTLYVDAQANPKSVNSVIILMDTSGNVIKQQEFDFSISDKFETARDFAPLPSGEFLLSGQLSNNGNGGKRNGFLSKLDSAGNVIWFKSYGEVGRLDDLNSVTVLADGNYLACGWRARDENPTGEQSAWDAWLVKVNPLNGDTIWTKTVNAAYYNYFIKTFEQPNGDLITAGGGGYADSANADAQIMRLDSLGNKLWVKRYGWPFDTITFNTSAENIYDFIQTSDGGYMIVGDARRYNTPTPQQSGWLLKLDSNGCLLAGCGSVGLVEYEVFSTLTFKAYPNPAQDRVQLAGELQDGDVITLYDFTGKILHHQVINSSEIPEIAVSEYANGIYLLSLYRSGYNKATQKLVIAR